jgi:hypothetical protein
LSISERLLVAVIELVECICECFVAELACLAHVLHDLVVKHGEVEGEAEADGVARVEALLRDLARVIIRCQCILLGPLEAVALRRLSNIAAVIPDHLLEEGLRLVVSRLSQHLLSDQPNDLVAVAVQLILNALLIVAHASGEFGIFLVLFDCPDSADGCALRGDQVLEGDGEQIALVDGQSGTLLLDNGLQEVYHVAVSLGLLCYASHENVFVNLRHI